MLAFWADLLSFGESAEGNLAHGLFVLFGVTKNHCGATVTSLAFNAYKYSAHVDSVLLCPVNGYCLDFGGVGGAAAILRNAEVTLSTSS
jgi:hypothetical protein